MGLIAFIRKIFNKKPEKKKLALALGSGGAKGFAHLGALKAFEEEGISFDIVTGTSIGSIVGAFYARGFSSENILHIFLSTDFTELIRHVRPKMNMKPIEDVIDKDLGGLDFSELKVPFACWATDEAENTGVLLNSGNVARACCASSAMPPFFSGVSISGHILADGAYTNSIPADVARNMGADFVIGIDLSAYKPVAEKKQNPVISAVFNKFNGQIKLVKLPDAKKRGYDNSDVMLEPNLREWRTTEFSQKNWKKIYDEGYTEAKNRMPEIKFMLKKAGFLFGGVKK